MSALRVLIGCRENEWRVKGFLVPRWRDRVCGGVVVYRGHPVDPPDSAATSTQIDQQVHWDL